MKYDDQPGKRRPKVGTGELAPKKAAAPRSAKRASAAPADGVKKPMHSTRPAIARPINVGEEATERRRTAPKPAVKRRDAEYLYPDESYYKKSSAKAYRYEDEYEQPKRRATKTTKSSRPTKGSAKKKKAKKRASGFFNTMFYAIIAIVAALVLSFVLRTFVFEVVRVSGDAMYDTLAEGDWVLVTKFDYKNQGSVPQRGTVVLVDGSNGVMFRRVVGMPEETIEIADSSDVMINTLALPEGYVRLQDYTAYPAVTLDRARYYVLSDNRQVRLDSREFGPVVKGQLMRARAVIWPLGRMGQIKIG